MILNFISDGATPHINQILRAVMARGDVTLRLWYAAEEFPALYTWKKNPTHELQQATIFGLKRPHLGLISHVLRHPDQGYCIVGWSNPTTRILIPLLVAARRPFTVLTDHPQEGPWRTLAQRAARKLYLTLLRQGAHMLAIGRNAVSYFTDRGFDPARVHNLPLPVAVYDNAAALRARRDEIRARYGVPPDGLFIVTGSRLIYEKGFDLLLEALARLDGTERAAIRTLIIGQGPELPNLRAQAALAGIDCFVVFEPWMDFADFAGALCAADLTVHPARFDAYGGITLTAVGLGVPVFGARGAGSAIELIEDGRNGRLYDAQDVETLANHIRDALRNPAALAPFGKESLAIAARWTPSVIADMLVAAVKAPHNRA